MSQFTIQTLTGNRALVSGTDNTGVSNKVVLDSSEWDEIKAHQNYHAAESDFDAEVEAFFAPLTEAATKLQQAGLGKVDDPATYVVLHEGTEGVKPVKPVIASLSHDSVVLRLIERGDFDRLVWVGDELEVLEVLAGTSTPTVDEVLVPLGAKVIYPQG